MAKELFKTSEKSNFILNLTEEKYSSITSKSLAAMFMLIPAFAAPIQFTDKVGHSFTTAGILIAGVAAMIFAMIGLIKKYIGRNMLVPVIAFSAMIGFGAISLFDCYNRQIGFYGSDGRGEGLLAIIFYFCFFICGLTLKTEKSVMTLLWGIIGSGVLNSIFGILQTFGVTQAVKGVADPYAYPTVYEKACVASGLSGSPIFLAMLLTLSLTAALIVFITSGNKKLRIAAIICSALFSFTMILTHTVMGIVGLAVGIAGAFAALIITKAPKIRIAGLLSAVIPPVIAVVIIMAGAVGDIKSYKLYDGRLMWKDSYFRLSASGIHDPKNADFNVDSFGSVYSYMTGETFDIIKKYPLTGTGPDQLVYPQMHKSYNVEENPNTFDRNYNEYLYVAATRGLPSLACLLVILAFLIGSSASIVNRNRRMTASVYPLVLMICGVILFFIGNSSSVFTPVFWAVSGASCARLAEVSKKTASKKHEKAYGRNK